MFNTLSKTAEPVHTGLLSESASHCSQDLCQPGFLALPWGRWGGAFRPRGSCLIRRAQSCQKAWRGWTRACLLAQLGAWRQRSRTPPKGELQGTWFTCQELRGRKANTINHQEACVNIL